MDGDCPVKVLMITKVVNLDAILGICEGTRPLLENAVDYILVGIPQFLAGVGNTQKPAAIDSTLTVNVYCLRLRVLEKQLHGSLKVRIPS